MIAGIDGSSWPPMALRHARAVLLLPFMNTVIVPSVLLLTFDDARLGASSLREDAISAVMSVPVLVAGIMLALRAIVLFIRKGNGTLAPWDPTQVLIADDIYRFSRNPMKAGLFLILIGECLLFRSTVLAVWTGAFVVANVIYIRTFEERGLSARFGPAYDDYCRRVPRWLGRVAVQGSRRAGAEQLS